MGRRYKQGTARSQYALLPPRIEDYVGEDNTVRAIDAYVETLDLDALGFRNAGGELAPGQPAFPHGESVLARLRLEGLGSVAGVVGHAQVVEDQADVARQALDGRGDGIAGLGFDDTDGEAT